MGLIHEKVYKQLHQKYKRAYFALFDKIRTVGQFGEKEDKLKFVETVTNGNISSFMPNDDKELVEMLEYLLDDTEPVKK